MFHCIYTCRIQFIFSWCVTFFFLYNIYRCMGFWTLWVGEFSYPSESSLQGTSRDSHSKWNSGSFYMFLARLLATFLALLVGLLVYGLDMLQDTMLFEHIESLPFSYSLLLHYRYSKHVYIFFFSLLRSEFLLSWYCYFLLA